MENRFGVRDLIQAVLLLMVIVFIGISIYQIDRQWGQMQAMTAEMKAQTSFTSDLFKAQQRQANNPEILALKAELTKLRETLEKGVMVQGSVNGSTSTNLVTPSQATSSNNVPDTTNTTQAPDAQGIVWGPITGADQPPFARVLAAHEMPGYDDKDIFVSIFSVIPDKITPLLSTDVYGSMVQATILESLAVRDPATLKWTPHIASWWRISDDGLNIEFELRKNVTFSDGVPLTVDDVVFSFDWMMDDRIESPRQKSYYNKIKSVKKVGDNRVRFTFKEPYFQSFELAAGMDIMAKHFYGDRTPEVFNKAAGLLLGSGPYKLADPENWKPEPGKPIEVVRNDRYWGPKAPFSRIIWRVIKDDSTRLTAFRNGEIDEFYPTPEQYLLMVEDKELVSRTQHQSYQSAVSGYRFIGWAQVNNNKPTIYADPRVRRAMTMMINRQKIVDEIYLGFGIPSSGPFNPLSPQSNPDIKPWPFDPDAARKLLAEAGFVDRNKDGLLDGPDGKALTVKISYPSASESYNRMVLLMKDDMAKSGVILQEDPLEWNVLLERIENKNIDAYMLGWSGSIESDPYQIFHSDMMKNGGDNTISYSNPKLDKLIEQARATVDEQKRMPLWHQVHAILHEDQPYTFIMTGKSTFFADKRIQNIKVVKNGLNPEIEWFVRQGQAKWIKP